MLLFQGQLLASWKSMMGHRLPQCSEEAFSVLVGTFVVTLFVTFPLIISNSPQKEIYLKDKMLCINIGNSDDDAVVQSRREHGALLVQLYNGQKCMLAGMVSK